jgi:hypothetical protein
MRGQIANEPGLISRNALQPYAPSEMLKPFLITQEHNGRIPHNEKRIRIVRLRVPSKIHAKRRNQAC